jgi:hypothetical protein
MRGAGVPHMVEMGWLPLRKGALSVGKSQGTRRQQLRKQINAMKRR